MASVLIVQFTLVAAFLLVALGDSLATNSNHRLRYDEQTHSYYSCTSKSSTEMILLGDWGGIPYRPYYTPFEYITAEQLMSYSNKNDVDSVLALGDNFYFDGVKNEYDKRFKETYEDVFRDANFKSIPWFVVGGNHDHYGNISGQIAYSNHSSRWHFPDLWYSMQITGPDYNATVIMIDTVMLCGNTNYDESSHGQPNGKTSQYMVNEQLEFIEQKLAGNRNQYIFVAGHFPVYSAAEHGPTECLLTKLKPLLEKYNVTAYLCGHDHNMQHIHEDSSPVHYFVSGAGNFIDKSMKHAGDLPTNSLRFYWAEYLGLGAFATMKITSSSAVVSYYTGIGNLVYNATMLPRIS